MSNEGTRSDYLVIKVADNFRAKDLQDALDQAARLGFVIDRTLQVGDVACIIMRRSLSEGSAK